MKKIIFIMLFSITSLFSVRAQENGFRGFSNGDSYISGSLNYKPIIGDSDLSGYVFSVSPLIGTFVTDNLAIEALLGYASNFQKDDFSDSSKVNTYTIGLGTSYYFTPMNKFSFTMGIHALYSKSNGEFGEEEIDLSKSYSFRITPGISYFLSDSFLLIASLGSVSYSVYKANDDFFNFDLDTEDLDVNLDLSNINLGLSYRF